MIIEVFKDYDQALRLFNSVRYNDNEPPSPEDFVGWQFDSINTYPDPQPEGTIYFDANSGKYTLSSTTQNIALDYQAPELVSWSGKYTVFEGQKWISELTFKDESGIDSGSYEVFLNGGSDQYLLRSSRKNSTAPDWTPTVEYSELVQDQSAITVSFQRNSVEKNKYRVTVEIDPSKLSQTALLGCTEYVSYLKAGIKIYDIAGNEIRCTLPIAFVLYKISADEILNDVSRLKLDFIDTYPENLMVDSDVIGKTTIRAVSSNEKLHKLGFHVRFGLKSDSVGYLSGRTESDGEEPLTTIQQIDGIDRSGRVKAFAYLDGTYDGQMKCSLEPVIISIQVDPNLAQLVRSATYKEAELGTFVIECEDNVRKINVDPFIPSVLRSEELYGLCKLFERYLNTMYTPVGSTCRIGLLEKISRIGKMKDPDSCESKLLPNFLEEHGSELSFTRADLKIAAETILRHLPDNTAITTDRVIDSIYRRYASITPYINRWKGTEKCFDLLFKVIGIDCRIEYLWEDSEGNFVTESDAGEDCSLSTHLRIAINSRGYTPDEIKKLVPFVTKCAKSVLPVNRVIDGITIEEFED